jgi:FkbM family methyltransferase
MSLKATIQQTLKRLGIYHRVTSSLVYEIYWSLADPTVLADRAREVKFYQRVLQGFKKGDSIFDIGANQGYKTDIFLRLGAKVVAVDPDEFNQNALTESFLKYRLVPRPVQIVGKAVSDSNANATMWVDTPGSAKNTLNAKWVESLREDETRFGHRLGFGSTRNVKTITSEELIERYGVPFFIKIDVEGHELAVLRGLKQPVPYLSFEVNLPEFALDGLQCIDRLHQVAATGEFNYARDCQSDLALKRWMSYLQFREMFAKITDSSIEVFWRT